jgi:hypothetical protein
MNMWLLSFLLLVAVGLLFRVRERFEDSVEDSEPLFDADQIELRNSHSKYKQKHMPQTYSHDINIARELNTRPALAEGFVSDNESRHRCPVCPDMSKYIRLDEVPCWNCSLP